MNIIVWDSGITQPEDKGILLKDVIESGEVDRKKSYCIDANYGKGGNVKRYFERSSRQMVFDNNKYRMLTCEECEKLQTVTMGYTNHVSKFWRKHMLGNGWTVDVIKHIFKGINQGNIC